MTGPIPEGPPRAPMGPDFGDLTPTAPYPRMARPAGAPRPADSGVGGAPTLPDHLAAPAADQAQAAAGSADAAAASADQARAAAGQAQAVAEAQHPAWVAPVAPVERRRTERVVTYVTDHGAVFAAGLLGVGVGLVGGILLDRYVLLPQGASVPTTGQTGTTGEGCTVTPLLNQAPNGSPVVIKVPAGDTVQGSLWWQNGGSSGYPWGNNEVGVQFQGGNTGLTVTTKGSAGGSLWEYTAGCGSPRVNGDRANYDTARRAATNFAGDKSLNDLQSAGAVTSTQTALEGSPVLGAPVAMAMHDRIAQRKADRIAKQTPVWRRLFA